MTTTLASDQHRQELLRGLQEHWVKGQFCDIKLQANDGQAVEAHKVILVACSKYFCSHFLEDHEIISLPETSKETLLILLDFIYTGEIKLSSENVRNVEQLSKILQIAGAEKLCKQFSNTLEKERKSSSIELCDVSSSVVNKGQEEIVDADDPEEADISSFEDHKASNQTQTQTRVSLRSSRRKTLDACKVSTPPPCDKGKAAVSIPLEASKTTKLVGQQLSKKTTRHEKSDVNALKVEVENVDEDFLENITRRRKRKCSLPKKWQDFTTDLRANIKGDSSVADSHQPPVKRVRRRKIVTSTQTTLDRVKVENETADVMESVSKLRNSKRKQTKALKITKILESNGNTSTGTEKTGMTEINVEQSQMSEDVSEMISEPSDVPLKKTCRRCCRKFDSRRSLEKHRKQCKEVNPFDSPDKYKRKRCATCRTEFPDYEAYAEHRKLHLDDRKKKMASKPFECDSCGMCFRCENFLACHKYTQHDIPFDDTKFDVLKCPEPNCKYVTVNKGRFQSHQRQHDDVRPFICDVCGKSFKFHSSLVAHAKIHSENRFECEDCGKTFANLVGKKQHVRRIHKREQPFLCHLCPYKCFVRLDLLHHLEKDHQIPVPKEYVRYTCNICDFQTFRRFHYNNHMNMHEDNRMYECEVCQKKYTSKAVLRSHMQFHKEPQFKCPWEDCKYAAVQKLRLEQHIRLRHTHKDEKPFCCHLCTYRAALNGNLKLHLRNVHHLDLRKRKQSRRKGKASDKRVDLPAESADTNVLQSLSTTSVRGSDIVQLAVESCEGISPIGTPQHEDMVTDTVVIYTDSSLPPQVTAAHVLQQLSSGTPLVTHSTAESAVAEAVAMVTQADMMMDLPEEAGSNTEIRESSHGREMLQDFQEMTREVRSKNAQNATASLSRVDVHHDFTAHKQEITHTDSLSHNAELLRDMQMRAMRGQEGSHELTSDLHHDNEGDSGIAMQDMVSPQYHSEAFLPDSRNLNLVVQFRSAEQNTYWSQY